jgi:phospholipase/carboxylesterase
MATMVTTLRDVRSGNWGDGVAPTVALLLHGYGATENDLTGLIPAIGLEIPWASLRAPIDLGGGAAWFQVVTPGDPDPEPLLAATDAIWAWVDTVAPESRVVPIGFSQGGLMASQLLRTRPERVMAPVILGGFTAGPPQVADAELADTKPAVFWGRGAEDRVITPAAIERTRAFLPAHSTLVERVYAGLGHGISAAQVDDVREFLTESVGPGALVIR